MGYPFTELVPPAILYENPGLPKEEFADLIDQVHCSPYVIFTSVDPWDSYRSFEPPREKGLTRLANILLLSKNPDVDEYLSSPTLLSMPNEEYAEIYYSIPPEDMFDFTQKSGEFYFNIAHHGFRWLNKDGKYYFDSESFDRMPISFRASRYYFGFTDLIVTAEAIRQKAWKLLSRKGLEHLPQFLKEFPDSDKRYTKAVFDAETSTNAKNRGLTNTQFLRMRLEGPVYSNRPADLF